MCVCVCVCVCACVQVVYNLMVGGYFSLKRNIMSIPAPFSITQEQLLPFTKALLEVFR